MNDEKNDEQFTVDDETEDQTSARQRSSDTPDDGLRDAIGAYLLDALPESERTEFEHYLDRTPDAQAEIRELAPVVALLPKLLDLEIETDGVLAPPAADLRERIVAEAQQMLIAELPAAAASPERTKTIRTAPPVTDQLAPRRAQGRIRSGVDSTPQPAGQRNAPISILTRFPRQWAVAAMVSLVAVGAIIWALALQSKIDNKNRELNAQTAEIAELRQNANATSYSLLASEGVDGAGGTLLFSLKDQIGVLYVHTLPSLSPDEVYQLWYLDDQSEAPKPGGTFTVDGNGNGVVTVASDTPTFDGVALTIEPEGGSQAPTTGIVLSGRLGGAAG